MELPYLPARRLTGHESLHRDGQPLAPHILDFWQWAASDLLGNTFRGWFAEFLVASDLGITAGTRRDWEGFDLQTDDGTRLEIKASAYLQSWKQRRLSQPRFSIRPAKAWDPATDTFTEAAARHSDAYVFCLLHHQDKATVDPLNVSQWTFYALPTRLLDTSFGSRQVLKLPQLKELAPPETRWGGIGHAIREALARKDAA
jgi:hypothetical protein